MAESDRDAAWELRETYGVIVQDEETMWLENGIRLVDRRLLWSLELPIVYRAA